MCDWTKPSQKSVIVWKTDSNSIIKNWKGLELRSNRPMNGRREQAVMKLPIPQYRQATQFACGPACLMMAMKFFQPNLRLTRELEFDIWREANLVESYGTRKDLLLPRQGGGSRSTPWEENLPHS
jgi:hypothetical protein